MKSFNSVLLIDDDPICNFISYEVIMKWHIAKEVHIACDGKKALEFLAEYQEKNGAIPELLILDLKMPVMDGYEFLLVFDKMFSEEKVRTKIIIVSSLFSQSDLKTFQKMGFRNYFDKPLTGKKLMNVLEEELFKVA
jgi:response regulator of citrate/malate metabolism